MTELADRELRVGRAAMDDFEELLERMDEARAAVAAVGGTAPETIALLHSTTEAMNVASWGIDWRPGDRAVTTRIEHPGALGPLISLRDRLGVELVFADVGSGADDEATLAALDVAITPRTRLVSVGHVAWTTGARLPIERIAELAHARGALLAVDGAQAIGAIPVGLADLGADLYAIPAQKWLLGPEGIAALYVAPGALDRVHQTFAGYFSFADAHSVERPVVHPSARRFETSGYGRPVVAGMARSLAWLSMYVGLDWVHRRGTALASAVAERLAAIPGVELLTPPAQMATLVSFRIPGWPVEAAFEEISRRSFAIFRTVPGDALRISVGFYNSDSELDRFIATVELVAGSTPETIPPRRTLEILG